MKNSEKAIGKKRSAGLDRRTALTAVVAGAAAGGLWHKPIINAVVLPAHAGTSVMMGIQPGQVFTSLNRTVVKSFHPLDLLISSANAGSTNTPGSNADVKVTYMGNDMFDYEHVNGRGSVRRTAQVTMGTVAVAMIVDNCSDSQGEPGVHNIDITEASPEGVTLTINDQTTFMLEPMDATLTTNCRDNNAN